MVWILICALLIVLIFLLVRLIIYLLKPERRLAIAQKRGTFYLLDYRNVRMNFLLTYRGHLFEGEKYATGDKVDNISIWMKDPYSTKLSDEEIESINQSIQSKYPVAKIEWRKNIK